MARVPYVLLVGLLALAGASNASSEVGVSVRPTKLWRFLDENGGVLPQRYREDIEEFGVGVVRCLRYCIESKTSANEVPSFLQLIWKLESRDNGMESASIFDKDLTPEILQGESIKSNGSQNMHNRCTFSIIIGCEIAKENENNLGDIETKFIKSLQPNADNIEDSSDNSSPALNFLNERLIDEKDLVNETGVSFRIQPNQAEMSVIIFGNVSKIDLKMPIAEASRLGARPRLALATTRMPGGEAGARLNVAEPPPGGWSLRVRGLDGQRYRLLVASAVLPQMPGSFAELGGEPFPLENANVQSMYEDSSIFSRQIKDLDENVDRMDDIIMSDDLENKHEQLPRTMPNTELLNQQAEPRSFQFPSAKNDIVTFDLYSNASTRMGADEDGIESRTIDRKSLELNDLNNPLNEELPLRKYLTVELNPRSELIANPGTYHRLIFDITNNHIMRLNYFLFPSSNPFSIFSIPYSLVAIGPGQTFSVPVDIIVPPQAVDTVNKVTLRVEGIEIVEKTANFYVRASASRELDDTKPRIDYYFNNNCNGRSTGEKCLKSYWSVDITVQDVESGLKTVTSLPKGIYPRTPYVSGTSSPVNFYYSNNCCNRVVEVTATDASGNLYSRRIDVDEWSNLTTGEILAIIFIILFIILLIILIVISIVYCYKRRRSHDLPYSQRYGSRSSPQ